MKRLSIIILTCLLLLGCTSCTSSGLEKKYLARRSEKEILEIVDNATSAKKLITKTCDIHSFAEKYTLRSIRGNTDLQGIANDMGVECLRTTEENALYSIHKIKQGGWLYIFYVNKDDYHGVNRWFYIQKELSYKDFDNIQEGSSLNDVEKIDPTIQIFKNIYDANPGSFLLTWHYLKDGILEFNFMESDGELKVSSKIFKEDYQIDQIGESTFRPYDGHILPIDWLV